jgi:tight adherence protein C
MIIFLIIGLALTALAVTLIVRALNVSRVRSNATISKIESYGFSGRTESVLLRTRKARTTVDDSVTRLGDFVSRHFGGLDNDKVRKELVGAGLYSLTPRKLAGYRAIAAFGLPLLCGWVLVSSSLPPILILLTVVIAGIAGWRLPRMLVSRRAARRAVDIDYQLPELIDLLVVTIEAGLGFSRSMQVASQRIEGPLGDELRLALQEQSMGLSTLDALRNMLARSDTPAMRSFVRSVVQGEALGVSIGQIMRNLAVEMRTRRRQMAEERAQKAPVKLLFPLIFLIFPAMFVVILGPAAYAFLAAFGN